MISEVPEEKLNGIEDNKEVWTGRKTLEEVWCGRYSLVNPANPSDTSGIKALETAINSKLEERLRISISDDYKITMENDTKDPWGNPYMGKFLTNVSKDRLDHGAIWIYSKGPNEQFCTLSHCAKGTVIIEAPLNNKPGIDDLSLVVYYTYRDGFGEVITDTFGFVQFGR